MDAAHTTFTKTALFLTIALLMAAPFSAQAQPAFSFPSGQSLTLTASNYGCIPVTSSTAAAITFTATQGAAASGTVDPQLSVSPGGSMNTSTLPSGAVCFAALTIPPNVTTGTHTITETLNAQSPSGVAAATITISWSASGTGGGTGSTGTTGTGSTGTTGTGGTGTGTNTGTALTFSPSSIVMSSTGGTLGTSIFYLNNVTSSPVTVNGISVTYTNGSGWLSLDTTSGVIQPPSNSSSGVAYVDVTANPAGLANQTYNANIIVTYVGGVITIPVSFTVGSNSTGGNGNLTASPNPVNLNYVTGGAGPTQFVTLTSSTGATTYNATTNGATWLLINGQSSVNGYTLASGLSITTILGNLPTANTLATITITDSNGNTLNLPVNLTVNGQTTNGISFSPSPVTVNAVTGQTSSASTIVTVTSSTAGTLSVVGYSGTGISASVVSPGTVSAGGTGQITVFGNPTGLSANTYTGTVTVSNGTTSATVNVNFVVGASGTSSGAVGPTSLQFNYEQGQNSSLIAQYITDSVTGAYTASVTSGSSWLSVTPSGTGPGLITVSVANVSSLSVGNYNGSFTVTTPSGTQTVNVTLLVAGNSRPVLFANPGVVNIPYTGGSSNPNTSIQVLASDSSTITLSATSSQSWLTVQQLNSTTPAGLYLTVNASGLPNGVNIANVVVASNAANASLVIPVVISVSGSTNSGGTLTLGSSALSFSAVLNGSVPASQTLSVTAATNTTYTATTTTNSGGSWLSISPSGSLTTNSNSSLTVSVNQSGLAAGTYTGNIALTTGSGTQNVPVTLVVGSSGGSTGNVTVSPTSLSFGPYQSGGTLPGSQAFNVYAVSGGSISYTVGVSTQTGGNWLSTNIQSGVTGQPVSVSVNPAGLQAGTYTGSVAVMPSGGTAVNVPVTLVIQGLPTVSASPSTLTLTYQAGAANTPTGTIQVSGSAANLSFTANASSTGGWLSVSPTTGNTGTSGTTLAVTVNPAGLTAGTYTGSIVVAGTSGATGTSTTTVTLNVTAPLPTISAVQNAASGAAGPVSPGEIVSIFGPAANPIGPGTPAYLTLDSNGNVSTKLGGVQVLFNGTPAPLTYVSSTQINAVVPYNVAGLAFPYVQVQYLGQSSNAFNLTTTSTAPAIFTQNGSGTGPGAVLNQDGSTNGSAGATKPATKGSVIAVYMTGEGATSPTGITGKVNCPTGSTCTISQLPVPLLPVTVTLIDSTGVRYPANYIFAGEAPGFVSGLLQVDVVIPTNVPSGTLQLIISIGGNSSQSGVTVAVQ